MQNPRDNCDDVYTYVANLMTGKTSGETAKTEEAAVLCSRNWVKKQTDIAN